METSNFRPELHVAQQSRREKLRVLQHNPNPDQNVEIYTNPLEQFPGHEGLSPDLAQLRSFRYGNHLSSSYEPAVFSSEMLHFAANSQVAIVQSNINSSAKVSGDPQNCNAWKSIGSQEHGDWVSNPAFVTEGLSGSLKPNNYGYQEFRSSLTGPSGDNMHFYHNAFQEVTSGTIVPSHAQQNSRETGRTSWVNTGNELLLLPAYDYSENKTNDNSNTQGLSLSLSSVPSSKPHVGQELASGGGCFNAKPSYSGKVLENVDMVGNSAFAHRGTTGPLGPFTGYATILKSSKFLRPAQQLLDEFCNILGPKPLSMLEGSDKVSSEMRPSSDGTITASESVAGTNLAGDCGGSSSTFLSSNGKMRVRDGGALSNPIEPCRPEYLQKKAKLLYMQDEVCKRYKHYYQQMQMVVSSFETVAGLSSATPYISLALKTVSRHFRCLKNAISDQLKNVRKALGEDLSSLTTGTSSTKGDTSSSKQKLIEQTFQKQKAIGGNLGYFEPQHHVWRPQRGLPERAVAILRAWLFDHFLHPYPTDADKHMLATQTGLTRNQVSNWFINARVRVWKPMVEEIHTLETKAMAEPGPSVGKTEGKATAEGGSGSNDSQALINRLSSSGFSDKQAECSEIASPAFAGNRMNADIWNQEKRSRLECRIPGSMDGSLVGFMPYQQSGMEIGGLGAVSLTLGLRQNADGLQQHHPLQQQHENQLRRHFGDHIIYDFVG